MNNTRLQILYIEDNPDDALLLETYINDLRDDISLTVHSTLGNGLRSMEEFSYDILFLDLSLPDSFGIEGVQKVIDKFPQVPVIVFTGLQDNQVAIESLKLGAQDFIVKGNFDSQLLAKAIFYAIERHKSDERLRMILDTAMDAIITIDEDNSIVMVNPAVTKMFGYEKHELMGQNINILIPDEVEDHKQLIEGFKRSRDQMKMTGELRNIFGQTKTGKLVPLETVISKMNLSGTRYYTATVRDISARLLAERKMKKAYKELADQKRLFESIINQSSEGIIAVDKELNFTVWNNRATEIIGIEKGEKDMLALAGKFQVDKQTNAKTEDFPTIVAINENKRAQADFFIEKEGSNDTYIQTHASPMYDEKGGLMGAVSVISDITSRKLSDEKLKQSEKKFRELVEAAPDGMIIFDTKGNIQLINKKIEKQFGYSWEELKYGTLESIFGDKLKMNFAELVKELIRKRNEQKGEDTIRKIQLLHSLGSVQHFEINFGLLKTDSGNLISGSIRDTTKQVQDNLAIRTAILQAEDKERTRIAHDLHDGLGQSIAAASMFVNSLRDVAEESFDTESMERFITCSKLINQSVKETRMISHNIMPNSLKLLGVQQALSELTTNINQVHEDLDIEIDSNIDNTRFSEEIELMIYRVIQEIINNTIKHANADHLSISMQQQNGNLWVKTKDNGVGFDISELGDGLGIESLKNRIDAVHGKLDIESSPGNGAQFEISVPISDKENLIDQ